MPSARMAPDGELSIGAFFTQNTQRYNLGFQALPWLEFNFRYAGLQHFDPQFPVYYDRSFGAKIRLWQETGLLPGLAVGANDMVGTGAYSGEYIVASKRFGSVDATLGMGWGRMGSTELFRNPLSLIKSSFDVRPDVFGVSSAPGAANFNALFHGRNVGLFGGATWATPVDGLSLVAEYSSDRYTAETQRGSFRPHNQFNIGASYQFAPTVNFGLNWLYGRALGASLSFQLDPVHDPYPQRLGPTPPEVRIRTAEEQQAALEALMGAHGTMLASVRSQAAASNAQLVDGLWSLKNLNDITLNGHVIALSFSGGDPDVICRSVAQLIARHDSTITSVKITRASTSRQCRVAAAPPLLVNANFSRDMGAVALTNLIAAPTLIHADGRTAAGDAAAIRKIRADSAKQQIDIQAVALTDSVATVYYSNSHYFSEADAVERLTDVLTQDAPVEIEKFQLIATYAGQPTRQFTILRAPLERDLSQTGAFNFGANVKMEPAPMENPVLAAATAGSYPRFSWFIFPQFRQQLFDPQNPFGVQFLAGLQSSVELLPGLSINGQAEASLFDTFNTNRPPSSDLPHVRTDYLRYFTQGKNGLALLDAEYRFRIAPTVFASVKAGYLESMFAGVGGEMLWRPLGQRWALGVDGFEVQSRDFDRLLGLQSYRAFTGHVSLYYASPWYDLNFVVRAGQYLAKDRGLTVEVTRRFATGVEIGAFFTKTNVSAQQFGEGSFDKGIIIRIPLNWIAPIETQAQFGMDLRPVQRDGGQRMVGDTSLYYETLRQSQEELERIQGN